MPVGKKASAAKKKPSNKVSAKKTTAGKSKGTKLPAKKKIVKKNTAKKTTKRMPSTKKPPVSIPTRKSTSTAKVASAKTATKSKFYYFFGGKSAEGNATMKDLLGGKGANLAEMSRTGILVPPGFTITTEVCRLFYENSMEIPSDIDADTEKHVAKIEKATGKIFGSSTTPLLVSVRSGSKFSMPGMMDTILNLGMNDEVAEGLAEQTGNARFALDSYRRFIAMFGNVVLGIDRQVFEDVITKRKVDRRIKQDSSLQVNDFKEIVKRYKQIVKRKSGEPFPEDPFVQLRMSRDAVFRSWNNPRAITYRRLNNIPSDIGTAVNVQAMVFGNSGNKSATGVGFTRNPSNGNKEFYGEYLINAQGEDVVAGVRTPQPIKRLGEEMPKPFKALKEITTRLEKHYRDLQDFEFTIEDQVLYMLQTRSGKRTVQAAIKIAVDMVKEGLITKEEALMRVDSSQIDKILHPGIDPKEKYEVIAKGLAASPGAASGKVCFTAEDAVGAGPKVAMILVRDETNPDDIEGMNAAAGILTSRGGMTSHAAVVARGMGKCCVSGAESVRVNVAKKRFQVGKLVVKEGEVITLNGTTGEIILGGVKTIEPELSVEFNEFMEWADEVRELGIRTNADTPRDAIKAIKFGAEGIGLCRTEHMFFAEDRIPIVQDMIVAETPAERAMALDRLLKFQKDDFKAIFKVMAGKPVTIRTLDPPLHEFLPREDEVQLKIDALDKKGDYYEEELEALQKMLRRIDELSELNPMLGHRGCRLGIVYPEITEMQVRAIMEAACELTKDKKKVFPEIMIPLVGHVNEFKNQKEVVERVAREVIARYKVKKLDYLVGTMIEIPRAALTADEIAAEAQFFSFGTNDLTQMAMGFSRDDAGKFLSYYLDNDILPHDPFISIDQAGVGQLVEIATDKGRAANKDIKIGICGEHGGDPESIFFCQKLGLDYVSCSPYRVPVARLAAAQAVLSEKAEKKAGKK